MQIKQVFVHLLLLLNFNYLIITSKNNDIIIFKYVLDTKY